MKILVMLYLIVIKRNFNIDLNNITLGNDFDNDDRDTIILISLLA